MRQKNKCIADASFKFFAFFFFLFNVSCSPHKVQLEPVVQPAEILKDLNSFLLYKESHIKLYEDFIAFDTLQNRISKAEFLKQYATGKFLPLKLKPLNDSLCYQLYKFNNADNVDILVSNKYWAEHENYFFSMEGKELPDFTFNSLTGKTYTKENINGKTVVLKCWFINCAPCVKEIPECNKIEASYRQRKDILFLAVSWDNKNELQAFIKKTPFNYDIIYGQKIFLQERLALSGYPTHIVIGPDGKIKKMNFDIKAMEYALQRQLAKPKPGFTNNSNLLL